MKILFFVLTMSLFVHAEEKMDPKKQEMMKKMMEYGTPGEEHKMLSEMAGNWSYTSKFWESPDKAPEESTGTSTLKTVLGGRFLEQEVKGTAMGQPFEGLGIVGYDKLKKQYDTIWLDSMGTGVMSGHGKYEAKTKTLKDKGEFTCPMEKDMTADYRSEWAMPDKNNMTFTMYGKGMENKEFKMMEMTYKRVQ